MNPLASFLASELPIEEADIAKAIDLFFSCEDPTATEAALAAMRSIMADEYSAGRSSISRLYTAYASEHEGPVAYFTSQAKAEEFRDRGAGDDVLFIEDDDIDVPLPDVILYLVCIDSDGKTPYHRYPVHNAKPGHQIKTEWRLFGCGERYEELQVHVEAKDRAEAIENALRVAKGIGFIG